MAHFYREENQNLLVYSERGLLSYFFFRILPNNYTMFLENSINTHGAALVNELDITNPVFFTEFELGNNGFGSPDGAIAVGAPGNRSINLIEAKAHNAVSAWTDPNIIAARIENIEALTDAAIKELCRDNKFNSSLNGQIELRWRFVNAVRSNRHLGYISERFAELNQQLMRCDRLYWLTRLNPNNDNINEWRRLSPDNADNAFLIEAANASQFFFVAITDDANFPGILAQARLFPNNNSALPENGFVYWCPLSYIQNYLEIA